MNELKPEDVMDILNRMDFFQGQRAGRELWFEKPFEVQEQDIADFTKGITAIKAFINTSLTLLRLREDLIKAADEEITKKDAEIERLQADLNIWKDIAHRETGYVEKAQAEAITEFFEKVCKEIEQTPNANEFFINAWKAKFAQIAKEMKGEQV